MRPKQRRHEPDARRMTAMQGLLPRQATLGSETVSDNPQVVLASAAAMQMIFRAPTCLLMAASWTGANWPVALQNPAIRSEPHGMLQTRQRRCSAFAQTIAQTAGPPGRSRLCLTVNTHAPRRFPFTCDRAATASLRRCKLLTAGEQRAVPPSATARCWDAGAWWKV